MPERHAVYATCTVPGPPAPAAAAERITFRIGQPTTWHRAQARWERLYPGRGRAGRVRHARRWYAVDFYEVRAVDRHGRGLGSERHARAVPVPYRAAQRAA